MGVQAEDSGCSGRTGVLESSICGSDSSSLTYRFSLFHVYNEDNIIVCALELMYAEN